MIATKRPLFEVVGARVYVAGHNGMVGSALIRRLGAERCYSLTVGRDIVDLTRMEDTHRWICAQRPDVVIVAAARVGGIAYNDTCPVDFLVDNLAIAINVISASYQAKVKKLLFLGSSCIYPKLAAQPIREECLLTGGVEPTNEPYAIAKIAGLKLV